MANFSNLKTAIENAVDWNNGDNEITGQNLLDILETIIDSLGAKYKFADVATPSSSITTPDEPLFYLAGAGTYTNFSGLSVTIPRGTLAIFYYDTAWHYTTVRTDSDAFFNVNQYLGAPSATYTKANARNAVPEALRSKGMIITYLTTNGWIIEQNLSTSGTWSDDASWVTTGPVSVSQNTLYAGNTALGEMSTTYDVTLHNSGATFASLSALLSDANLSTLIPANVRKSGMTIKFVQSSDNKYVQYRYMGTDVTGTPNPFLDTNNWSFCGNDVLINNSTWLEVVIDGDNKILYGVKKDGKVYFGDGCPPQVQEYVIGGLLGKVDKVTGKSLINTDVASSQDVVNNPKWLEAVTDNEGRVLEGITKNFKKTIYIPTEFSVLPNGVLPYIVVDKSGKGHYTTLTEATDEAPDGSTILVMPGLYDDEVITAGITKTLFIIGIDRDKCIIQNNYGLYAQAPINMASGLLRNLTIKNTATTRHEELEPSYAIHSDFEPMLNSTFRIENCTITSSMEAFPVIGVGLRGGSDGGALIISGCLIESISRSGCLLCHDNPGSHDSDGLQRLVVTDCILNNNSNEVGSAVHITSMGCVDRTFNDTQFYIEFVRNRVFGRVVFRNYYEDNPEYLGEITQDDFQGIKNLRLSTLSWGNSTSVLNNID